MQALQGFLFPSLSEREEMTSFFSVEETKKQKREGCGAFIAIRLEAITFRYGGRVASKYTGKSFAVLSSSEESIAQSPSSLKPKLHPSLPRSSMEMWWLQRQCVGWTGLGFVSGK